MELAKNEFVVNKINTRRLKILAIILLFCLLYGINNTYVYYASLMPFGVGIVLALLFVGFNGYILGIIYLLSFLISCFNLPTILQGINVGFVIALIQWFRESRGFVLRKWYLFLLFPMTLFTYVICSIGANIDILAMIVSIILGLLFLFACVVFLDATIGRGMLCKINLDEKICGCTILIIFSIGICGAHINIFNIGLIFTTLILLVIIRLTNANVSIVCGVLVGIGFSVYYLNPIFISLLVVMTLGAISFKCNCKYLSAIAIVLLYVIFSVFFSTGLAIGDVLSVVIGSFIYIVIPNKSLTNFSNLFARSKMVVMNSIFNNGKKELIARIKNLSNVFIEMDKVYRDMVRGNLSDNDAKSMIKDELVSVVCAECNNQDRCYRNGVAYMEQCVENIVSVGYDKGKLLLIDLPEYLTTNCCKVGSIIQSFNNLISSYNDYKTAINNVDTSRVLIAEQLGGVAKLLDALSNEVDVNICVGNRLEEIIKERLGYMGILCVECVIYEKSANVKSINLIVKNDHYNDKKIIKAVNKVLSSRYQIVSVQPSDIVGAVDVVLTNKPNYDIVFGSCSLAQRGKIISGDKHSVIPISDDKFMISICDGMGSGKEASRISGLTLSLIENFYKAGFSNETILSSVNKVLSLNEGDRFSTIDLCIIDTRKNIYDFIKLGATVGYIKRASGEVEVISSSGLPVGILDNISPHITKSYIKNMDIIILVSDGVSDILGDSLKTIILNSDTINPQLLSEEILSKAIDYNNGDYVDDMTVICARVFESD